MEAFLIISGIILWLASGALSYAWSVDWHIEKGDIPLMLCISTFGLIAVPEAMRIKRQGE